MGIRRPSTDVFDAFVDPDTITRFWIAESTGPLQRAATVTWTMNAAGAEATVKVQEFDRPKRLSFEWGDADAMSRVDLGFSDTQAGHCLVEVTETGFDGTGDELAAHAADSTGGFTMVLCSLKALLEHNLELCAVNDRNLD